MAATRLMSLRTSRPLGLGWAASSSSSMNNLASSAAITRCIRESHLNGEKKLSGVSKKKPLVVVKASMSASESVITSEPQTNGGVDLASLLANITVTTLMVLKVATKRRPWKLYAQILIERVIIDCRFFTLFAVVGSLVGSILCFVEGCFLVLESYFQYFHSISQSSDQGHVMHLLIEAIDMFLIGTAMLTFGMGLHVMFVGSKCMKGKGSQLPASNFFGLFYLKTLPRWVGMQSVAHAKSKIGHAMMMIMQVGVLEKFKSIPLATGLDLACFAGAVFVSSACTFLLSRLSVGGSRSDL